MCLPDEKCTGCGTCATICPQKCIDMKKDAEGFYYPNIDEKRCIKCGLCEKRCPILQREEVFNEIEVAYAAKNKNIDIRKASSSGGVFTELAKHVLVQDGYICAAEYTKDFRVIHTIVEKEENLEKLRGAKYTQSKSWQCFELIKSYLENNKPVLFVGTPCQVSGLNTYLNKKYDNLILVDMICHGVPSEKVWEKYIEQRQELDSKNGKLESINLRSKATGWSRYNYSVEFNYTDKCKYSVIQSHDWYLKGFIENLYLRPSCADCKYKGINRQSDFTLGDYWGIWNQQPDFDDNFGVSVLLLHSKKAKKIWRKVKESFEYIDVDIENAICENPSAVNNSTPHYNRKLFFENIEKTENVIALIKQCMDFEDKPQRECLLKQVIKRLFLNR